MADYTYALENQGQGTPEASGIQAFSSQPLSYGQPPPSSIQTTASGDWTGPMSTGTAPWSFMGDYWSNANQKAQDLYDVNKRAWGLGQAIKAGIAETIPQLQSNQFERENLANQIAMQNAQYMYGTRNLQEDAAFGRRELDLQGKEQDVARQALERQPGFLNRMHDLAQQGFTLSRRGRTAENAQQRRALDSAATARGAFTSVGANQGRLDLMGQLSRQMEGIGIQSDEETARYFENMANLNDQRQKMDFDAERLGMSREQLERTLQRGLEGLGLTNAVKVGDLYTAVGQSSLEDRMLIENMKNNALSSGGYFEQFYNPAKGSTSSGAKYTGPKSRAY